MTDSSNTPGAMERTLTRDLPDGTTLTYEEAPAGWLTPWGERRYMPWRAYHHSWQCETCEGEGRLYDKSVRGRNCPDCRGLGTCRVRYPSVTTILGSVDPKPGLVPWAEARGIEGAVEAIRRGEIDPQDAASAENAVAVVRALKLGADRARDTAAERGVNVHALLENYMRTGTAPNPIQHPPEHWGYIRALTRWLLEVNPEPKAVEQIVCHPQDGYAGRMDLRACVGELLVTYDAKTQERGGIFRSAHVQARLYDRAEEACGGVAADRLAVIVFAANGEFREMECVASEDMAVRALRFAEEARKVDSACSAANRAEIEARKAAA